MGWFTPRCPVVAEEQRWTEENLAWFVREFGDSWLRSPVVLPTDDFFPGGYSGSEEDMRRVVHQLCVHLSVDPDRIRVELHAERVGGRELQKVAGGSASWSGAAGHYRVVEGRPVISLEESLGLRPLALVATVAHELAHERLLGEGRVDPYRRDQEPLTDLLTVYLGFGVFAANAALEFAGQRTGWSASRLGYLTEPMYGYALARYAWLRGETAPDWARHVDTNPRTYLRRGLRYLRRTGVPTGPPAVADS
ncbi:hypothetical protein ACN28C_29530 [Plantactinospora sp. WMMC1484]|uniref:hypothetical protein n=1 Tax=Plantactinospora sp. WMMC1484 TaxID=3404122 RepID=UPI003BF56E5E